MRASEITDILNAVTHGAVNRQMMAAPTIFVSDHSLIYVGGGFYYALD